MFTFTSDQKIVEVGDVKIGGQYGVNPTVLVSTIFYEGHDIVKDEVTGEIDEAHAEDKINSVLELSDKTGNPVIFDIFGATPEAIKKYIDFVTDYTDNPFFIDSGEPETKIEAAKYLTDIGLADNAIYNSLSLKSEEEEVESLKKTDVETAVLLLTNIKNPTVKGKMDLVREGGSVLEKAKSAGIDKKIIDPSIIDAPDIGIASEVIYKIKDELGLPAGVGSANFYDLWKKKDELSDDIRDITRTEGIVFPICFGADFLMYGPIEFSEKVFHSAALYDSLIGYTKRFAGEELSDNHPLEVYFR